MMNSDVIWLALGAGAAAGVVGGLMSFRKDRWIAFVIAIGAGVLGGIISNRLLMVTQSVAPRVIVIDSNGSTRAELGVSQDSGYLRIMDSSGNERVRLEGGTGSQRPCFLLKDTRQKPLIAFGALEEGTALLDLRGSKEKLLWSEPAQSTAAGASIHPNQ